MLELKDASLTLNGRRLFDNLSFMALDGQITCITGPAGSGKTAMLQAMLGLLALDEGLVSIDGELLTPLSAPTFRRMMAYVPQSLTPGPSSPTPRPSPVGRGVLGGSSSPPYWGGAGGEAETVWSPYNIRQYQLTAIEEPLNLAPIASKAVIIADDPDDLMWATLRKLAAAGRAVVVATTREEYLNQSDKIIRLGNHDTVIS